MSPIISYSLTFLSGLFVGVLGNYLASRWAEKSKEKDIQKKRKKQYQQIKQKMPSLMDEIKTDIKIPELKSCRVFYILPSKSIVFNSAHPAFSYFEDEHENLKSKIGILEEAEFIYDITEKNTPKYQFSEEFIDFLIKEK